MEQYKKTSNEALKDLLAEKLTIYLSLVTSCSDHENVHPYKLEVDLLQAEIIRRHRSHGIDITDFA